ncbi:hypothetical protein CVT25_009866 [Psilocybe cyanescens]|uniref:Uncharacterized protein n=1 Tax=Psilocybe cyanescens TaxID=93625 RepID=A0A409XTF8_PSICY|nr:hypothetical protein CVT25_009866 [Psilocybe cyanescens]
MQGNMSYRKPVPEYIPSPLPSPSPSPTPSPLSSVQVEALSSTRLDEDVQEEKPVPPLPDNWREILAEKVNAIEAVTLEADVTNANASILTEEERDITETILLPPPSSGEPFTFANIDKDQESFTTIAASQQLHSQKQRNGRGLPTKYRPPTPPLRSHSKQLFSDIHSSHEVYLHNTPSNPYHRSYVQLKPSSSFRTERTMISMNTTNYSTGWPNGLPTSSSRPMYSYPTLLIQKRNVDALRAPDPDSSNDPNADTGCLFNACWPKFSGWTKRFTGFGSISK